MHTEIQASSALKQTIPLSIEAELQTFFDEAELDEFFDHFEPLTVDMRSLRAEAA